MKRGKTRKNHLPIILRYVTGRAVLAAALLAAGAVGIQGGTWAMDQSSIYATHPPKTEGEKAASQVYQESAAADQLFSRHKYAEAAALYAAGRDAMQKVFRRDPAAQGYLIPVAKNDLTMARKYFKGAENALNHDCIDALTYSGILEVMLVHTLQITGGKAPEGVFSDTDENIISHAYRDIHDTQLPVPDDQWAGVVAKLEMAQAKLEGVIARRLEYRTELVDRSNWPEVTGEKALGEAKQKLAEARPELEKASANLQKSVPENVQYDIEDTIRQIDKMIAQAKAGEFLPAREADLMVGDRPEYIKQLTKRLENECRQAGKAFSPAALQPIIARLDALQAAVDAHAAHNAFPAGQSHDEALEASLRRQIARNDPQAHVLKTAMIDANWEILKNDLDIPKSRRKAGWVLYKLPTEKWARLYRVVYYENYAGGGRYEKADGADSYPFVRWQQAEGAAGANPPKKH